ncbi:hypothetical protein [Cyprinid herpesvirus 3]|uniref:Uncharacterized protein n=1 Tax=Cyprinid herpesvirus 3 TaxID=180230 RepID=A4FTD3_CYHV3|nr:hypothetical protein [Cyprinid herpesvirus 3]
MAVGAVSMKLMTDLPAVAGMLGELPNVPTRYENPSKVEDAVGVCGRCEADDGEDGLPLVRGPGHPREGGDELGGGRPDVGGGGEEPEGVDDCQVIGEEGRPHGKVLALDGADGT